MKVPWLFFPGAAAQAAPLVAAAVARRPVGTARAWILVWCALLVLVDGASLWLGREGASNLVLFTLVTPLSGAIVLWVLSCWQTGDLPRLTLRVAIIPLLLAWTALTYGLEDSSSFSRVAQPMAYLICLGAAAFTLVARSRRAEGPLHRRDWFWVSGGLALYFGAASALSPLSSLLVKEAPDLVIRAYEVKSALDVLAFLAIARGVTCPAET